MWIFTIVVAVLDHVLAHKDPKNVYFSVAHIVVTSYIGIALVVLGVSTKLWMVKKEEAGVGRNCQAGRHVSFMDVPGLLQSKIGAAISVVILITCFGKYLV